MLFSVQVCTGKQLQLLQRTVEKLHNTILSISTENTKYKMLVEDLAEKNDYSRKTYRRVREKVQN